jgi:hypothetical protein
LQQEKATTGATTEPKPKATEATSSSITDQFLDDAHIEERGQK